VGLTYGWREGSQDFGSHSRSIPGRGSARKRSSNTCRKRDAMTDNRQAALRALIDGRSDPELLDTVRDASGSYEAFLNETMGGMVQAFEPKAAQDCVIGYEILAPDGTYVYRVEVQGNTVTIEQRPPAKARVVLGLSLPDYVRLISGLLDGTQAFMTGRLKLRGDVMFAPQIARIFPRQ
jgi:hypothetical protein